MAVDYQSSGSGFPALDDILNGGINHKVEDDPMEVWDKGVFLNELHRQNLVLKTNSDGEVDGSLAAKAGLKQGTYHGTRMALTELYSLIEEAHVSHYDTQGFEPIIPTQRMLEQKRDVYKWSDGTDGYPPHLNELPDDQKDGASGVGIIFDSTKLRAIGGIAQFVQFIIPTDITHQGTPYVGPTLADVEKYNSDHPSAKTDIMDGRNIGDLSDWYSDARFAQQHLSGVNPTTIQAAKEEQIEPYIAEASKQGLPGMEKLLKDNDHLFIQDYSYFKKATKVSDDFEFRNDIYSQVSSTGVLSGDKVSRYACASVIIFQIHEDGLIHPLAITLDYKGSVAKSITIFNKRLTPNDKGIVDEKDDWPWRYAKTCAQTADWARHEVAVHLVDTHMIEEAIIVATNRTIPEDHIVHEILSPHWFRTLALNAAARKVLVPGVISRLAGFGPDMRPIPGVNRAFGLVDYSFKNFDFQGKYIPNDLKNRGIDLNAQGNRYRNYPYAICMTYLWELIREFVKTVLATKYKCDNDIKADTYLSDWCKEIQEQGQIKTFPTITTVDQLIDAITMCIHVASPQHTAVNYLQDYYYSFVPAKPPALCTPLPKDLKTLLSYGEKELTNALPIGTDGPKWKDWLLAAQLPELLSFKVENRYSLLNYAKSLYNVNKGRTAFENKKYNAIAIKDAAARFYSQLKDCDLAFQFLSASQTEGTIEYKVLQPELTAVSILI